ncbi:hypothetical protein ACIBEJ_00845 [Nonomuraea sp. NPDC050790]|uniref:hypothetical protein n=1 Tax=Nonomuraea sp. NPDC050790 TaxID=3364371 RepID=UPI00378D3E1B
MSEDERVKALNALRGAQRALIDAEDDVTQAVVDARHVKAPWRMIAEELGVAQPNAVRKYKPHLASRPARTTWQGEPDPKAPALVAVRHAVRAFQDAERAELEAVAAARNADVTWDDIADALGMKQPNAVAKYRPQLSVTVQVQVKPPAG